MGRTGEVYLVSEEISTDQSGYWLCFSGFESDEVRVLLRSLVALCNVLYRVFPIQSDVKTRGQHKDCEHKNGNRRAPPELERPEYCVVGQDRKGFCRVDGPSPRKKLDNSKVLYSPYCAQHQHDENDRKDERLGYMPALLYRIGAVYSGSLVHLLFNCLELGQNAHNDEGKILPYIYYYHGQHRCVGAPEPRNTDSYILKG